MYLHALTSIGFVTAATTVTALQLHRLLQVEDGLSSHTLVTRETPNHANTLAERLERTLNADGVSTAYPDLDPELSKESANAGEDSELLQAIESMMNRSKGGIVFGSSGHATTIDLKPRGSPQNAADKANEVIIHAQNALTRQMVPSQTKNGGTTSRMWVYSTSVPGLDEMIKAQASAWLKPYSVRNKPPYPTFSWSGLLSMPHTSPLPLSGYPITSTHSQKDKYRYYGGTRTYTVHDGSVTAWQTLWGKHLDKESKIQSSASNAQFMPPKDIPEEVLRSFLDGLSTTVFNDRTTIDAGATITRNHGADTTEFFELFSDALRATAMAVALKFVEPSFAGVTTTRIPRPSTTWGGATSATVSIEVTGTSSVLQLRVIGPSLDTNYKNALATFVPFYAALASSVMGKLETHPIALPTIARPMITLLPKATPAPAIVVRSVQSTETHASPSTARPNVLASRGHFASPSSSAKSSSNDATTYQMTHAHPRPESKTAHELINKVVEFSDGKAVTTKTTTISCSEKTSTTSAVYLPGFTAHGVQIVTLCDDQPPVTSCDPEILCGFRTEARPSLTLSERAQSKGPMLAPTPVSVTGRSHGHDSDTTERISDNLKDMAKDLLSEVADDLKSVAERSAVMNPSEIGPVIVTIPAASPKEASELTTSTTDGSLVVYPISSPPDPLELSAWMFLADHTARDPTGNVMLDGTETTWTLPSSSTPMNTPETSSQAAEVLLMVTTMTVFVPTSSLDGVTPSTSSSSSTTRKTEIQPVSHVTVFDPSLNATITASTSHLDASKRHLTESRRNYSDNSETPEIQPKTVAAVVMSDLGDLIRNLMDVLVLTADGTTTSFVRPASATFAPRSGTTRLSHLPGVVEDFFKDLTDSYKTRPDPNPARSMRAHTGRNVNAKSASTHTMLAPRDVVEQKADVSGSTIIVAAVTKPPMSTISQSTDLPNNTASFYQGSYASEVKGTMHHRGLLHSLGPLGAALLGFALGCLLMSIIACATCLRRRHDRKKADGSHHGEKRRRLNNIILRRRVGKAENAEQSGGAHGEQAVEVVRAAESRAAPQTTTTVHAV